MLLSTAPSCMSCPITAADEHSFHFLPLETSHKQARKEHITASLHPFPIPLHHALTPQPPCPPSLTAASSNAETTPLIRPPRRNLSRPHHLEQARPHHLTPSPVPVPLLAPREGLSPTPTTSPSAPMPSKACSMHVLLNCRN